MNKFFKFFFIYFFIVSCGYQPIFSGKKVNFGIKNLIYDKNNKIDLTINKNLKNYKNLKNKDKILDLEISSKINKITTSLDDRGDPKSFRLELEVKTIVKKNNKLLSEKKFIKSQNYNNNTNKFDLKKYENLIKGNMVDKITEEIITYILSLEI
jgi:outer membrane lipopolysaccharide assembly protein LptE/RlpB